MASITVNETRSKEEKPSFLSEVNRIFTGCESTLENLRLITHPINVSLEDCIPTTLQPSECVLVSSVVPEYLKQKRNGHAYFCEIPKDFVEEEASKTPENVRFWQRRMYDKSKIIGARAECFAQIIKSLTSGAIRETQARLGLEQRVEDLDPRFFDSLSVLFKQRLYLDAGITDDPEMLYGMVFNRLVQERGWDKLDDQKLREALTKEGIALELFAKYTGRKVKEVANIFGGEPASRRSSGAQTTNLPSDVDYEIMPTAINYPTGVAELNRVCSGENNQVHPTHRKQDGTIIYRSFRFEENIRTRKDTYESCELNDPNRLRLFGHWLDSCCGAAYKKKSTKLKLNPQCKQLIEIDPNFSEAYLPVEYDSLHESDGWVELDRSQEDFKERAWLVALDGNTGLYRAYRRIVLAEKPDASMNFHTRQNTDEDELRPVFVSDLSNDSVANGNYSLSNNACFLRAVPHQ